MQKLNGWILDDDTTGYYAIGGGQRFGPFDTPQDLRHWANRNRCPHTKTEHMRRAERRRSSFLLADD